MIRLEDQPVIVQTIYHWSAVRTLERAVLALLGLIVDILVWRLGRTGNCEDQEEAGEVLTEDSREVGSGGG